MLAASNITKSFGGRQIIRGVNITVEPGKITALIGPSGAGKTTLLRALSLLDCPDSGVVSVNGSTYSFPVGPGERIVPPWPRVTVVFQQLFLWPHLTLRQNITLPVENRTGRAAVSHLDELTRLFDMEEFIDRYPNQASLGQRQRAALARALVLQPELILLDEITSSLDVEQVRAILSHLQTLRDKGIGILIITHLLGFARRASDQVVFLDEGEIVEQGPPDILHSPHSERLKRFVSVVEAAS